MSKIKGLLSTMGIIVLIINSVVLADWKDDAKVIRISGGEAHTLILTANKWAWGAGDNTYHQLG